MCRENAHDDLRDHGLAGFAHQRHGATGHDIERDAANRYGARGVQVERHRQILHLLV